MTTRRIKIGKKSIKASLIKLLDKNLIVLAGKKGYVMCGYLDLKAANAFKEVAIKVTGVSTIKEVLEAKAHSVSLAAKKLGLHKGQGVKDVLKTIA